MEKHLYTILYPREALVSSQLEPEPFARHYCHGTARYYSGKLIFVELDPSFRNPYFDIDGGFAKTVPHESGRPKSTLFISTYRILEHVDLKAFKKLYLVNPDGGTMGLDQANYDVQHVDDGHFRIMADLAPTSFLSLTKLNLPEYGQFFTDTRLMKRLPALGYTQLELHTDEFLQELEEFPMMESPISCVHPTRLRDAIEELEGEENKQVKSLSLTAPFTSIPFKLIKRGFMFVKEGESIFYPIPSLDEIWDKHPRFWRSL